MKFTITLHPVSLLVGAAALGGVLWLVSAVQALTSHVGAGQIPVTLGAPIEVKGIPVPGQIVRLSNAALPYTVPQGRTFVLTAMLPGAFYDEAVAQLRINGAPVCVLAASTNVLGSGISQITLGSGIVAKTGESVNLTDAGGNPLLPPVVLVGYLSN